MSTGVLAYFFDWSRWALSWSFSHYQVYSSSFSYSSFVLIPSPYAHRVFELHHIFIVLIGIKTQIIIETHSWFPVISLEVPRSQVCSSDGRVGPSLPEHPEALSLVVKRVGEKSVFWHVDFWRAINERVAWRSSRSPVPTSVPPLLTITSLRTHWWRMLANQELENMDPCRFRCVISPDVWFSTPSWQMWFLSGFHVFRGMYLYGWQCFHMDIRDRLG